MPLEVVVGMFAVTGAIWALARQFRAARLEQGLFSVERDDASMYQFRTDLGAFTIDRDRQVFRWLLAERSRAIPLDRIERLEFAQYEDKSFAQRWFWMDETSWNEIVLVAAGRKLPLFAVGQVSPRRHVESDQDLPAEWFPDLDRRSQVVLQELYEAFRASGRIVPAPGGVTIRAPK